MPHIFAQIIHHPVSYKLGPLQFTGFGFAMLMTFVIGQIITQREMERRGQNSEVVGDMPQIRIASSPSMRSPAWSR